MKKILLVACLTTLGQCVIFLMPLGSGVGKLIIGFGGLMAGSIWLLFRPVKKDYFCRLLLSACLASSVLGGSLQLLENLLFINGLSWLNLVSLTALCGLAIRKIWEKFTERKNRMIREVHLFFPGGSKMSLLALVDSGNSLTEPISRKPVSLVEEKLFVEIRDELKENRFCLVPFHSIGQATGLLEAYRIEGMEIEQDGKWKKIKEPVIGLTKEKISSKENYQMILHPALLENRRISL